MGGTTPLLIEPRNREEFVDCIRRLRGEGTRFRLLGGGANILIDDRGIDEAIVLTSGVTFVQRDGEGTEILRLGAGVSIPWFVQHVRTMKLTGAECLVGIPGTIGGATVMNAGGRHGWLSAIARRVHVLNADGEEEVIDVDDSTFAYRTSIFGDDRIVLETVVELTPGDPKASSDLIRTYLKEKSAAQPLTQKSAGCVFKNHRNDDVQWSAGKLLDAAGVKGMSEGGVAVSEKHANFIVNRGGATMADVVALVGRMRDAVQESAGVTLGTEVKSWARAD